MHCPCSLLTLWHHNQFIYDDDDDTYNYDAHSQHNGQPKDLQEKLLETAGAVFYKPYTLYDSQQFQFTEDTQSHTTTQHERHCWLSYYDHF